MPIFNMSQLELDAKTAADFYGIGTTGTRGNGDNRDAFRHAYISAVMKDHFQASNNSVDQIKATAWAYAAGIIVEVGNSGNYDSFERGDYNQDLWNDLKGAQYNPASGMTPAQYAKHLLDTGQLITSSDEANQSGRVASVTPLFEIIATAPENFKNFADAFKSAVGDFFGFGSGDPDEAAASNNAVLQGARATVEDVASGRKLYFVANDATFAAEGETHLLKDVMQSLSDASSAVSQFISELGTSGTSWFSSGDASLSFATWLGANIGDLIDGTLDADDALIALATHLSQDFLADHLIRPAITSVAGAEARIATVLEQLGVSDGAAYAGAINTALGRIALDFVTSGFDAEQALNAGIATLGGAISQVYLAKTFGWAPADSAPAVAGVTTVINGLIHSGGFNSGDWAMLGVANDNCMMKQEMVG